MKIARDLAVDNDFACGDSNSTQRDRPTVSLRLKRDRTLNFAIICKSSSLVILPSIVRVCPRHAHIARRRIFGLTEALR